MAAIAGGPGMSLVIDGDGLDGDGLDGDGLDVDGLDSSTFDCSGEAVGCTGFALSGVNLGV